METVMVVEVLSGHDRVRARHRFAAPGGEVQCTVGRGAACDVVLDDPFAAALHARIIVDSEGTVVVSDLESVNGVEVGGRRVHGVERMPVADGVVRVGRTRLRVRTAREVLPPEQVDQPAPAWRVRAPEQRLLAAAFALSVALTAFEVWTTTWRPRELSTTLVTTLLTTLAVAGLWIALWALATRVAFGESRWMRHAMIVFVAYAVFMLVMGLAELVSGSLGLHVPWSVAGPVAIGIVVGVVLSSHLVNASVMRARLAVAIGVAIPAVAVTALLWMAARNENRSPSHIDDRDVILPPALVLRRGQPLDAFAADLADLKARADARRAFVEREDPSPREDYLD